MEAYRKETHAGGRDYSEPVATYDVYPRMSAVLFTRWIS